MAVEQYESIEQIDKEFAKRLKDVDDPLEQANLRAERAEAVAAFHASTSQATQHQAWVTAAVAKHSIPEELVDMIDRFGTQEEIEKAAERLSSLRQAPAPTSAELYGGGGPGGGAPVHQSKDRDGEWLSDFESRWNNREQMSPAEYQRYVTLRLGRHTAQAMKENGKPHLWDGVDLKAAGFERY